MRRIEVIATFIDRHGEVVKRFEEMRCFSSIKRAGEFFQDEVFHYPETVRVVLDFALPYSEADVEHVEKTECKHKPCQCMFPVFFTKFDGDLLP